MRRLFVLAIALMFAAECSHGNSVSGVVVNITPSTASVTPGETVAFVANVSGLSDTEVDWSIDEGSAGGSITTDGVYTAPDSGGTFHVLAKSRADASRTAAASVNVTTASGGAGGSDGTTANGGASGRGGAGGGSSSTQTDNVPLVGPITFTHPASPDPPALYPPNDVLPPESSDIAVKITASRTSGVAPLHVFFDAAGSLNAADGDVDMRATYLWSFDTTKVDSNTRYNRVSGFVAGHVFNLPGTYTVRLDVFDASQKHGSSTVTIKVDAFSGSTYYVAANGNDSNAGSLKAPFKTATKGLSMAKANTRILFRNGDVFPLTNLDVNAAGPVIVAGYSDTSSPSAVRPEIHSTSVDNSWFVLGLNGTDWRLVGIKISSGGSTFAGPRYPSGINVVGKNNLVSRCDLVNLGSGFGFGGDGGHAVYETEIHNISTYGIFASDAKRQVSFIGNYMHDWKSDQQEHAYRMQSGQGYFLGFNVMEANNTKSGVQIRGNSDHVVVYSNVLDRGSGMHPQNSTSVEHEHHCIFDSNIFIGRTDPAYTNGSTVRQNAISVGAKDIVIRNNIIYNYDSAILLEDDRPTIDQTTRVRLENNTTISPTVGSSFSTQSAALAVTMLNNIHYSTASSTNQYDKFLNLGKSGLDSASSSDYNQIFGTSWSASTTKLFGDSLIDTWQKAGQDTHSKFADPAIAVTDPTAANFGQPKSAMTGTRAGTCLDARGRFRSQASAVGALEAP